MLKFSFQNSLQSFKSFILIWCESLLIYGVKGCRCRNRYTLNKKKLTSLTRDCNLPIFTANETISNLTQYELCQEESDVLKAGL